jgi:hypothetical protein
VTNYVLIVRDPDSSNDVTIDGDVEVIDIDLGSSFDGSPEDAERALRWAQNLEGLADVPVGSPVFQAAVDTVAQAVADYDEASAWVDAYVARRNIGTEGQR